MPGDSTWLAESLRQYYPLLDDLVIPVPSHGLGWSGQPIPVDECLGVIRAIDTRGILRIVEGEWVDIADPLSADTAQRQAALDALRGRVDWVLQLDGDEFLPRPAVVSDVIEIAEREHAVAVEVPMRVLFRRTKRHVWEVVQASGAILHEYPAPVIVRPEARLVDARRAAGTFVRLTAEEAAGSLQLRHSLAEGEKRVAGFAEADAIVHNSWARSPSSIRRKGTGWGHAKQISFTRYFWLRWWPTPALWWALRDLHPFSRGLWPRLRRLPNAGEVADSPTAGDLS